jgi:5-methylthioadenosine/S-adenosylhomocysteine deaminase
VTTLVSGGVVLTMAGTPQALDPGAVLFDTDAILAVGPPAEVASHPAAAAAEVVDSAGCAVLPGLHNCHLHSGLLRGTAESLALWEWLRSYVDPAHRALTPEIAAQASRLCYAESVLAGTTSVMDMWRFMSGSAAAAREIGLRATLVPYVADADGFDYFETTATNRLLLEEVAASTSSRVRAWVGLEHLLYCSESCFAEARSLAEEFDVGIHTHSSETLWEVQESLRRWGRRPIEVMWDRGILGRKTVVAHCVWVDDREIELLARSETAVAHCPCSNMKLASGPARVGALRSRGVTVGLGTDGEKENNNLDLLEEMKFASLLQKVSTLDPATGDPWEVLRMATCDAAGALGLAERTGSLEPGKQADLIVVDLTGLHTTPLLHGANLNVAAHLVFAASGRDVRDVWVEGHRLVERGRPLTFDPVAVRHDAQAAAEELFARRAALVDPGVRGPLPPRLNEP